MDLSYFPRGAGIGFVVAAGVGPISLLVIRRTLAHGRTYGLASGTGVAAADASYGAIAAFGLSVVTAALVGARAALALAGALWLIWLGVRTIVARPPEPGAMPVERPGLLRAAVSIYGLTMTNPATILSFAAIFAGFGLAGGTVAEAVLLTLGVFGGSLAWWVLLTSVVGALRARVTSGVLAWVTRLSGVALLAFGAIALGVAAGIA